MARAGLDTEAVVGAAARLADEQGLQRLTLARLATRLGVRSPSLYAHVQGLADLRARLAARGVRELTQALQVAAAGRARGDALHAVAVAYREYARAHPGTYAAIQVPVARSENGAAKLVELLVAVLHGYGLDGEEAIHAVRIVRAALHGFVALEAEGGFAMPIGLDDSYERLIAVLDGGLAAGWSR